MAENAYYFGRGRVYLTPPLTAAGGVSNTGYGGRAGTNWGTIPLRPGSVRMPPGRFAGNVSAFGLAIQADPLQVPDFLTTEENDFAPYIVRSVDIGMSMFIHSAANLADHLAGLRTSAVGHDVTETIAASQATVAAGGMLYVDHAVDLTRPVTVTPSWTTWTAGVDYEPEEYGLRMLHGYAGPVGATIQVQYTKEGGASEIEALQLPRLECGLVYVGVNLLTGRPARVDCYRVALKPAEAFAPLNEQINKLPIAGALKAVRPSGTSRARWFRIMNGGLGG